MCLILKKIKSYFLLYYLIVIIFFHVPCSLASTSSFECVQERARASHQIAQRYIRVYFDDTGSHQKRKFVRNVRNVTLSLPPLRTLRERE